MNLKAFFSGGVHRTFNAFGYDIQVVPARPTNKEIDSCYPVASAQQALHRLRKHEIGFNSLIDVGASDGRWSKMFAAQFPGKRHLLLDANRTHLEALEYSCKKNPDWEFRLCAVGQEKGTLYFDDSDPLGGHLAKSPINEHYKPCSVETIDDLVLETGLPGPYFVKLDTHGVELPILEGAKQTLGNTNVLVIEAYNFTFGEPAVPFWDLCHYMFQLGFRPLDVFDILYREVDNAFWQFDLLFARSSLPLFKDPRYFIAGRR